MNNNNTLIKTQPIILSQVEYDQITIAPNFDSDIIYNVVDESDEDTNFYYEGHLTETIEDVPKKVSGNFECTNNKNLKSLKGCPKYIFGNIILSDNSSLIDISDIPPMVDEIIDCRGCESIEIFTKTIDTESCELTFKNVPFIIKERVCNWSYYEVISIDQCNGLYTVVVKEASEEERFFKEC